LKQQVRLLSPMDSNGNEDNQWRQTTKSSCNCGRPPVEGAWPEVFATLPSRMIPTISFFLFFFFCANGTGPVSNQGGHRPHFEPCFEKFSGYAADRWTILSGHMMLLQLEVSRGPGAVNINEAQHSHASIRWVIRSLSTILLRFYRETNVQVPLEVTAVAALACS